MQRNTICTRTNDALGLQRGKRVNLLIIIKFASPRIPNEIDSDNPSLGVLFNGNMRIYRTVFRSRGTIPFLESEICICWFRPVIGTFRHSRNNRGRRSFQTVVDNRDIGIFVSLPWFAKDGVGQSIGGA